MDNEKMEMAKTVTMAAPTIKVRMFKEFIFDDYHLKTVFVGELINFKSELDQEHCYVSLNSTNTNANNIDNYFFTFSNEEEAIKNAISNWKVADYKHTEKDVSYIREFSYNLPKFYGWKSIDYTSTFASVNVCTFVANIIHVARFDEYIHNGKYEFVGDICINSNHRNDTILTFNAIPSVNGYSIELKGPYNAYLDYPEINHILRDTFGVANISIINAIYAVIHNYIYDHMNNNNTSIRLVMDIVGDMPFDKAKDHISKLFNSGIIDYYIASIAMTILS